MSGDLDRFRAILADAASGRPLGREDARMAFDLMMQGDATPAQMGGLLMALRVRGETVDEIAAGAEAMRARMVEIAAPEGAIDTCGTGGDGSGTYNISTAAAIVVAACGVPVAKHGNRGLSSRSGSAEVLEALGVDIDGEPERIARCISDAGIGFMMAPRHHGAMRHVAGSRVELGTRTIFNLLGPLSNPAGVKRQLLGVYDARWIEPLAEVLHALGSEHAWVVHGDGGLDELSPSGPTQVAELRDGKVRTFTVTPEDAGLPRHPLDAIKGGDPGANATALRAVLAGETGAHRDAVVLAAAAALIVAGRAATLDEGASLATSRIDEGAAAATLDRLIVVSHGRE
ncbi:MAG: anthranilate phosphoribosyltransferase [Pseudomonadota bacterium]